MSYTPPNPNGQATMANSAPVVIASDQSAVEVEVTASVLPTGAATLAEQQTQTTTLGDIYTEQQTQTTELTAIKTAVELLDNAISGNEMQVDVVAALPTGGNTIGSIASITTSIVPGTGATNLGKAEDSAHSSGDVGVMSLAVRSDTASATGANGDYVPLIVNSTGLLHVVNSSNETSTKEVVGDAAVDSAIAGNPVLQGARASTATPTAVSADNDVQALWVDRNGAQVVAGRLLDDSAFTIGTDRVHAQGLLADETTPDSVDEGDIGIARMTLDRKTIVSPYAHTAGGATPYKLISAATTNATSVKASAGQVYSIMATNTNAAVRYLKLYNKASAPTVGTDTPVQVYALPGATTGGGFTLSIPVGMTFATGIAFATTTGAADSDTGAVAANEVIINLTYT